MKTTDDSLATAAHVSFWKQDRIKKKLMIFLGVPGGSASATLARISTAPSMVLVLYRCLITSIFLSPVALQIQYRTEMAGLFKKDLALCLISGFFMGLHFASFYESLHYTSIASATVLVYTEVFWVALATLFIFKDKISWKGWLGIFIAFAGSGMIALADSGAGDSLKGDLFALAGAACMAVYTIIGKFCREKITNIVYSFLVFTAAAFTILILVLFSGLPLWGYGWVNFWTALGMAVFCTLLGHCVYSWGLKYEKPAFVSMVKLLEPVCAVLLGLLFFREVPGIWVIVGSCVVLSGILYYTKVGG